MTHARDLWKQSSDAYLLALQECHAVAPAAEGPRAVPACAKPVGGGHPCVRAAGHSDDCFNARAALPGGAEAGTPDAADRLRAFVRSHTTGGCRVLSVGDNCPCPLCDIDRLAALTSEVRALREDKARLDFIELTYATVERGLCSMGYFDWRIEIRDSSNGITYREGTDIDLRDAIDAARLASPSPTGAT